MNGGQREPHAPMLSPAVRADSRTLVVAPSDFRRRSSFDNGVQRRGSTGMISNRVGRAMAVVTRLCARRPRTTVAVATAIAVCALLYAWRDLGFVTSPYRLLPQDARYVILLQQHLREFGELNDIVVAVASAEPETMKAFTVRLADELARSGVGGRMTYRVETASLEHKAL